MVDVRHSGVLPTLGSRTHILIPTVVHIHTELNTSRKQIATLPNWQTAKLPTNQQQNNKTKQQHRNKATHNQTRTKPWFLTLDVKVVLAWFCGTSVRHSEVVRWNCVTLLKRLWKPRFFSPQHSGMTWCQ